jgi:hypothetical protein
MPARPAQIWKSLPSETRLAAAEAFWADTGTEVAAQQIEAVVMLARRLNFRPKSMQAMPSDRRARHLANITDVSDALASRALIAYHFARQRPLMAAFLDALGIAHENGLITAEQVDPPAADRIAAALGTVRAAFPSPDVDLYSRTLVSLDGETWANLDTEITATS